MVFSSGSWYLDKYTKVFVSIFLFLGTIVKFIRGKIMKNYEFGNNLRYLRESRGWYQEDLAKKVGVSVISVKKWESGNLPSGGNLINLADLFNISLDDLVCRKFSNEYSKCFLEDSLPKEICFALDYLHKTLKRYFNEE